MVCLIRSLFISIVTKRINNDLAIFYDYFMFFLFIENRLVICENDYPYYFTEGIGHSVLWSLKQPTKEEISNAVKDCFPEDIYDVIVMENPYKTVKNVYHLQIFYRKKKE